MSQFRYKALSMAGESLEGLMEAASAEEVVAKLQDAGHIPVETRRADAAGEGSSLRALLRKKALGQAEVLQFTQQLATLLGAGQPLDRALAILLDLPESTQAKAVIARIRDSVRGGGTLSAALEAQHGLFSRLYVNMVRAGEVGGSLHETLSRLADYLERSAALRGRVINALVYPCILLGMVGLSVSILLVYVVPQFKEMFEGLDAELPLLTRIVLGVGDVFKDGWPWLIAGSALAVMALLRKRRDPAFRQALDAWLLKRKFTGGMIAKLETARLARTMGTMVRNGVPLLASLSIARNVLGNRVLAAALDEASAEVKTGSGLGHALARRKVFPHLALQMIQVGEESGDLDGMLFKVADTFDAETGQALDRMLAALVPLITVLMAVVVGGVVMAILVPIFDLTSSIG